MKNHSPIKNARDLRKNMTQEEKILWHYLRGKKYFNAKFRRQSILYGFIVDFVCLKHKIIIECDGEYHSNQEKYDFTRDDFLFKKGFNTLRLANSEIANNIEGAIQKIAALIEKVLTRVNHDQRV